MRREDRVRLVKDVDAAGTGPGRLHEAMRYSVFAGGKRLRPLLTLAAARLCGPSFCGGSATHAADLRLSPRAAPVRPPASAAPSCYQ